MVEEKIGFREGWGLTKFTTQVVPEIARSFLWVKATKKKRSNKPSRELKKALGPVELG